MPIQFTRSVTFSPTSGSRAVLPSLAVSGRRVFPRKTKNMASSKRPALLASFLCATALLLVTQQGGRAQSGGDGGLQFFKNYFLTGDYVVAGVGLRGGGVNGTATGTIDLAAVPPGVDIAAAYLYWQVVSRSTLGPDSGNTGVTFRGHALNTPEGPIGKVLGNAGSAPCWSSGGGTGPSGGQHRTYTYRADVLRFFDIDNDTGKVTANGAHQVQIPDSGSSGNSVPIALGASLVVFYRDPSKPLSAFVVYDGSYTIDNSNLTLSQTIKGFYQPSTVPEAKISYIVGSGQANKNENLLLPGGLLVASPFGSYAGESWDTGPSPDRPPLPAVPSSTRPRH